MDKILSVFGEFHIHPILVHFPIALFISAMGLQATAVLFKKEKLEEVAWINFILAVLITPLVILTGLLEARHLHLAHRVADIHKIFAFWTFGISFVSALVLRALKKKCPKKLFRIIFFILLVIVAVLISICGYFGGRLVYEYGIGMAE